MSLRRPRPRPCSDSHVPSQQPQGQPAAGEREALRFPGNNWEPGWGLYSGSQNIWPRIGQRGGGRGWPVLWLPVLPSCFLLIAGLLAISVTLRPRGGGQLPPAGDSLFWPGQGLQGARVSSRRGVVGHSIQACGRSTVLGVHLSCGCGLNGCVLLGSRALSKSPSLIKRGSCVSIFLPHLHPWHPNLAPKEPQVWGRQRTSDAFQGM